MMTVAVTRCNPRIPAACSALIGEQWAVQVSEDCPATASVDAWLYLSPQLTAGRAP